VFNKFICIGMSRLRTTGHVLSSRDDSGIDGIGFRGIDCMKES